MKKKKKDFERTGAETVEDVWQSSHAKGSFRSETEGNPPLPSSLLPPHTQREGTRSIALVVICIGALRSMTTRMYLFRTMQNQSITLSLALSRSLPPLLSLSLSLSLINPGTQVL